MTLRTPLVAGNWKMHTTRAGAVELARSVREGAGRLGGVDVAVIPPFVYLDAVAKELAGSGVAVGAQDVCEHAEGAYTGEVSAAMLRDVGATFALVGHSERRHVFGEDLARVAAKVGGALAGGIDVMLCVGETLEERDGGRTEYVVREQLTTALERVDKDAMRRVTIAYEPVWAIGTGRNATPAQAAEVHTYIRGLLAGRFGDAVARTVRILYGGSVKPENAGALLASPDVDGALVGGASLRSDPFLTIAGAAK